MNLNSTKSFAPAKLILVGEHFVVYHGHAIACPLDAFFTEIEIDKLNQSEKWNIETQPKLSHDDRQLALKLINRCAERYPSFASGRIRVRSTIPIGCGLGSSASFAVALCSAFSNATKNNSYLKSQTLYEHALELEKIVHGQPSGVDCAVIAHRQAIEFIKDQTLNFLTLPPQMALVVALSERPLPTRAAIDKVASFKTQSPEQFSALCEKSRYSIQDAKKAIENQNMIALGHILNQTQSMLSTIGVSTEHLNTLIQSARDAGALGAKLTGAGLGGFMFALTTPKDAPKIEASLLKNGARITKIIAPTEGKR